MIKIKPEIVGCLITVIFANGKFSNFYAHFKNQNDCESFCKQYSDFHCNTMDILTDHLQRNLERFNYVNFKNIGHERCASDCTCQKVRDIIVRGTGVLLNVDYQGKPVEGYVCYFYDAPKAEKFVDEVCCKFDGTRMIGSDDYKSIIKNFLDGVTGIVKYVELSCSPLKLSRKKVADKQFGTTISAEQTGCLLTVKYSNNNVQNFYCFFPTRHDASKFSLAIDALSKKIPEGGIPYSKFESTLQKYLDSTNVIHVTDTGSRKYVAEEVNVVSVSLIDNGVLLSLSYDDGLEENFFCFFNDWNSASSFDTGIHFLNAFLKREGEYFETLETVVELDLEEARKFFKEDEFFNSVDFETGAHSDARDLIIEIHNASTPNPRTKPSDFTNAVNKAKKLLSYKAFHTDVEELLNEYLSKHNVIHVKHIGNRKYAKRMLIAKKLIDLASHIL